MVFVVDHSRILEEVTRTSIALLLQEPFYSHFFSTLNKEVVAPDDVIQTMAVGLRERKHVLYVNPVFWDNFFTDKRHRYGVVKHEILHIVYKHTLANVRGFNRHLVNIAMDIVVNQYIDKAQLPAESIFLEDFPELSLKPDGSWQYYYEKLLHLQQNLNTLFANTASAAALQSIRDSSHGLERHGAWEEIGTLDEIEKGLLDADIDNLVHIARARTNEKSYGKLPAGLKAYLDQLLYKAKPLVDWRRVIKLFSESSSKTRIRNTLKRPSKRYGTNPGIRVRRLKKLLVAVDTSGSINKEELHDFFNEIHHLWRGGAEILVVECDAQVKRAYAYKGIAPSFVLGRGGTNFNPPIEYGNREFYPDGLIYFTDGVAHPPTATPRFPVLWVISRNGIKPDSTSFQQLPGRKARLVS